MSQAGKGGIQLRVSQNKLLGVRGPWLVLHISGLLRSMSTKEKSLHMLEIWNKSVVQSHCAPAAERGGTGPGRSVNHAFQSRKVALSVERLRERRRLLPTKEAHYFK